MHVSPVMASLIEIIRRKSNSLTPLDTPTQPSLKKIHGIKCALFDVYGTLMVSGVGDISLSNADDRGKVIPDLFDTVGIPLKKEFTQPGQAFNNIVATHQEKSRQTGIEYPEVDIREVWSDFIMQNAEPQNTTPASSLIEELAVRFELTVNPTWPMPHAESTLFKLIESGLKLGIVSNAQFFTPLLFEAYFEKKLDTLGFEDDLCQWSYDFREAKPSVRMYRVNAMKLEARYGIRTEEVLYIGNDLLNDIVPASKIGFKTALFAGDKRSLRWREGDSRTQGVTPDLVITSLDQLINCLSD
jgi:putative hydrolase of the HAD superfamily